MKRDNRTMVLPGIEPAPPPPPPPPVDPVRSAAARALRLGSAVKSHEQAAADADLGIERASKRATPEWTADAVQLTRSFARQLPPGKPFLIEDAREWAAKQQLNAPPDGRAWGAVPRVLKKEGFLESCGYAPARSSNRSPKVQWKRIKP